MRALHRGRQKRPGPSERAAHQRRLPQISVVRDKPRPVGDHVDSGAPMSTNRRIYLDFNATAPLVPAARDAMVEAMADVGNPSSVHAEGRRMRDRVERARNQVAALVGRPREQIVFTSGGTEANWLGVMGLAAAAEQRGLPKVVATTPIEHPSLAGAVDALVQRGWVRAPHGSALPDELGLLAVGLVNHELGTMFPRETIMQAHGRGAFVHLDAVQAAGKLALQQIAADSIAISAHKIGGPQGVGALAISVDDGLPIIEAGHQERGRRPGTENTLGIVGFGAAAAAIDLAAGSAVGSYERLASWMPVALLGEQLANRIGAMHGARVYAVHSHSVGGTINAAWSGAL
ncbi:MAG TPA: aminotransferase class V-fold PLP-dependent enzyme, partial [Kofleriaceae bacterium]